MKKYLYLTFLLLTASFSYAQNNAWLIPRVIYVGDPATLVVSLPGAENTGDYFLYPESPNFPTDTDIDFHKITLERRTAGSRLLIEFTAFTPGLLELPAIEIERERFAGLTVTVNSVVDTTTPLILSRPASPLAIPGTSLMLYGIMAISILLFLLILWFFMKGRKFLQAWIEKWKRKQLFNSMRIVEKRLNRLLQKGGDKRKIVDKLSIEFRNFLSIFTKLNCRAMTANEFKLLPEFLQDSEYTSAFLANFFSRCDEIRFCGGELETKEISQLLESLRLYLAALEKTKEGGAA